MTDRIDEPRTEDLRTDPAPVEPGDRVPAGLASDPGDTVPERTIGDDDVDAGVKDGDDGDDLASVAPAPSTFERVARRVLRRPVEWAERPWPNDRIIRLVFTVIAVGATTAFMMNVVHLNPLANRDLVFDDTTPTGGDFGAHVWGPAYLRDHLLPSFRLNGWSMDWYAGMPAYRFYMVLPAIAVTILDRFLAYGVALKLVSVLGLVTFPASCWAFGRLAKFRAPIPELFAFAGLAFALDESFSIYGGNLKSTMAGEFSFSIALSLGMLALGFLANGLRTGKYRVWTSVLIAAACVSHGIVLIYVVVAALILCLVWMDGRRLVYAVTVGVTSFLLIMWWAGPFLLGHEYMTDMKYGPRLDWWEMYFPLTAPLDFLVTTFAIFGFAMCIVRRQLTGVALGITCIVAALGVYVAKESLPLIGLLWNPRVLPFFYLLRYLLMVIGAYELLNLVWNAVRDRRALEDASAAAGTAFAAATALPILIVLGFMFQVLPLGGNEAQADGSQRYTWGPITATETNAKAQGNGWSEYNFRGYEGRNEYYTEYHQVVSTMAAIGEDPAYGCGRALWENHPDNGFYGTTMALMLLPYWTDGCIGSMEGLFFEASGTTPYHFLATAAMSKQSSNPVRQLRYVDNDASVGVRHLQDLGVRYAMVRSPEAKAEAEANPDLTLIASSPPWDVYLVADSEVIVPLDTQPVVVNGRDGDQRERYLELGTSWFQHHDEWAAIPAADGPDDWQRIDVQVDLSRREGQPGDIDRRVDIVVPSEAIEPVSLPEVAVSGVEIRDQSLEFDVDQVGVPVLVKVSYFPNWKASGAEGPYRAGPNMMVVVPTETHVELSYGRTATDYASMLLTLIGIGLCVLWRRQGDVEYAGEFPSWFGDGRPDPLDDLDDTTDPGWTEQDADAAVERREHDEPDKRDELREHGEHGWGRPGASWPPAGPDVTAAERSAPPDLDEPDDLAWAEPVDGVAGEDHGDHGPGDSGREESRASWPPEGPDVTGAGRSAPRPPDR